MRCYFFVCLFNLKFEIPQYIFLMFTSILTVNKMKIPQFHFLNKFLANITTQYKHKFKSRFIRAHFAAENSQFWPFFTQSVAFSYKNSEWEDHAMHFPSHLRHYLQNDHLDMIFFCLSTCIFLP